MSTPLSPPIGGRTSCLLLALLLVTACQGGGGGAAGTPTAAPSVRAVATLPPLAWLVDRIGGERVETAVLLPPGTSPHAYEPSPRQLQALGSAALLLAVGHAHLTFEAHQVERLVDGSGGPEVVAMADAVPPHDDGTDPHLWTSPRNVAATAGPVAAALERLDPAGAATYRRNLATLRAELDALEGELRRVFTGLPRHTFYVQHPAWGHLAAQYGLRQVALEEEGKEPGPRELVALVETARRDGVAAIFVQRGEPRQAARVFAGETGARVVELDPLAYDWPTETRRTADALHAALTAPTPP